MISSPKRARRKCCTTIPSPSKEETGQGSVDVLEVALTKEHNVGGILNLRQDPVILDPEMSNNRAKAPGKAVEPFVDGASIELVGESLGLVPIIDVGESVVHQGKSHRLLAHLDREPTVAVEVDLQAKRAPGGHADVAKTQLCPAGGYPATTHTGAAVCSCVGSVMLRQDPA